MRATRRRVGMPQSTHTRTPTSFPSRTPTERSTQSNISDPDTRANLLITALPWLLNGRPRPTNTPLTALTTYTPCTRTSAQVCAPFEPPEFPRSHLPTAISGDAAPKSTPGFYQPYSMFLTPQFAGYQHAHYEHHPEMQPQAYVAPNGYYPVFLGAPTSVVLTSLFSLSDC